MTVHYCCKCRGETGNLPFNVEGVLFYICDACHDKAHIWKPEEMRELFSNVFGKPPGVPKG